MDAKRPSVAACLRACSESLADFAQASVLDRPAVALVITHDIQPVLSDLVKRVEAIERTKE